MIGKVIQCTFYILETPEADLPELHWNPYQYCSGVKIICKIKKQINIRENIHTAVPLVCRPMSVAAVKRARTSEAQEVARRARVSPR